jgi:hypothetical protein
MHSYSKFPVNSDSAIGLDLLFGIVIPDNFDAPYRTTCVIDFWRRWHMTLSRMLRDYLYISLGGSRYGLSRQVSALLVTMLLGGLWHGAGWTFVIWGGLHGIALTANHLWRRGGATLPAPLGLIITFLFVVAAFVIFRADSVSTARHVLAAMAGADGLSLQVQLAESGWRPPLLGSILNETVMWLAIALVFALAGLTSQAVVRTWLKPRWPVAVALAVVLLPDRRTRRRGRGGICLLPVLTQKPRAETQAWRRFASASRGDRKPSCCLPSPSLRSSILMTASLFHRPGSDTGSPPMSAMRFRA